MNNIFRKTYAEINLPNLYENYKNIQKIIPDKKIVPVVKANAYGHGVLEVVDFLRHKSVDQYAVSLLEEALQLRVKFSDIHIIMMGVIHPDQYEIASKNNITITISNFDQIDALLTVSYPLVIHLKIDKHPCINTSKNV